VKSLVSAAFCAFFLIPAFAGASQAGCAGQDLLAGLAPGRRAAIEAAAAAVPHPEGRLFRATRAGAEITLVGTLHLPDARHAPLEAQLAPILSGAQVLLVEAGPEEEAQLAARMGQPGSPMFSTGPTLPERLPEAEWAHLAAELTARGIPPFLGAKMEPWFLSTMLAVSPCWLQELNRGGKGLDARLIEAAGAQGVAVRALEPWDTVFELFGAMTEEEEILGLRVALMQAGQAEDMTFTLSELYFQGRIRMIWELGADLARELAPEIGLDAAELDAQLAEADVLLVSGRNRAWIAPIEAAAAEGPVLVAVGALHLPGAEGVLALLEERGWSVSRLD
jgi:hypothetical protein